ncbi:MAG: type II toxin-antitoxin system VapC family toxin, partial [Thermoanaerobaculia bacterium]
GATAGRAGRSQRAGRASRGAGVGAVKFWDSSAVVPLLTREPWTDELVSVLREDGSLLVWWGSPVECASALSRREREGALRPEHAAEAFERLDELAKSWSEVEAGALVRESARRFLRVHDLRAADALQLAAAFVASESRPTTLELVTLDDRLAAAAKKEGFRVFDRRSLKA